MSKVWLITGCSSGLGRTLAERALARGHTVVATARRVESLAGLGGEHANRCLTLALDVTDEASVRRGVDACVERFGRLDVVCSNAGYAVIGGIEEFSDEQIARNLDTNLMGPIRLLRAALPVLRRQKSGHLLVVSAIAALSNHEGFSIYGGAKAGLEGVMEAVALDVKPLGIRTTLVLPGPTRTDFIARSLERGATTISDYDATAGKFARLLAGMSGKQTGDPVKVAELMIDATESENPPLRLITGKYALTRAKAKIRSLGAEIEAWEARAAATDY
jgi:NAD(P)-dependent dehydrogenase (short-subunit alcohol dehydrogenase family)